MVSVTLDQNTSTTDVLFRFDVNPKAQWQCISVGNEALPVWIVDDFWLQPQALAELAACADSKEEFAEEPGDYYPGVRRYFYRSGTDVSDIGAYLQKSLASALNKQLQQAGTLEFLALSLATKSPQQVKPIQLIPHFDSVSEQQYAVVGYLFKNDSGANEQTSEHGGTSFYRHRETGFESITQQRAPQYMKTLQRQATTVGMPKGEFINGDTALFERIYQVPAKFNRMLVYSANLLHSGDLQANSLSANPNIGRLTWNACFNC
ncbi:hypothetical protein KIH87_08460 [Paraneptunicella aestuarii]|uniref:DUF6445 family protein n=1 Tax=Paraneptunicella aestuarii TaxID=2831148 RepID=UPI001E3057CC|nr:DUF6445 family protein [Paraneptunicella aestuarii]UAA40350.1 hypothetical protein KIH87_08460 [Paraneptunicella aestuarii]